MILNLSLFVTQNTGLDDRTNFGQKILHEGGFNANINEKPKGTYAFADSYIQPTNSVKITTRQTYSLLDWLGDIGGLHDSLILIVQLFLKPY